MSMMKKICTLFILCSAFVWAASSEVELLGKYRKIYDDSIAKYDTHFRGATIAWPIEYIESLQSLQAKFQSSGNLNDWDVVKKELDRFREEPTLSGVKSPLAEISKLQDSYRDHAQNLKTERDAKCEDLRKQYVSRLTALKKDWTQKGEFDAAYAVRDEIERVGGMPEEDVGRREAKNDNRGKPLSEKASVPAEAVTLADGTNILPAGLPAPKREGLSFKAKSLSSTSHSPFASSVYIKLWESSDKESDSFERDKFVGSMDGKVKSDVRHARVGLRMSKPNTEAKGLQVRVEYYAKPAAGSGDARLAASKKIPIDFLDTRVVYVDVAPVSIDSLSRSISGHFREHSKTVGDKFYGYIVTVLDSKGAVLYQGATSGTLAKEAVIPGVNVDQGRREERRDGEQRINERPRPLRKPWKR